MWKRWRRSSLAVAALAAMGRAAPAAGPAACLPLRTEPAGIVTVDDRLDLRLASGAAARLAGIHVPGSGEHARLALQRLLSAPGVSLAAPPGRADRWGRAPVDLFDAGLGSIAGQLVAAGLAQVRPGPLAPSCTRALLRLEEAARRQGRGLWAGGAGVLRATDLKGLRAVDGRFTIVEGRIRGIGGGRGTVFLNFGTIRRHDFSVAIGRRTLQRLEASGMTGPSLQGRRVRVRGVIAGSGTPRIDLAEPEEIERID